MSTDREFTRIVRSWLEEGVTTLPDRVLDAVLDQVPATRQRRARWPAWRLPNMNISVQFRRATAAVVVVAVIVLAVVGLSLLPKNGGVGAPSSTPVPTSTAASAPSGTPAAGKGLPLLGETPNPLAPGTYVAADPFLLNATFTVPAGWDGTIGSPYGVFLKEAQGPGAVTLSIFDRVYADPCHSDNGFPDPLPGQSVDDLVTALVHLPGLTATTPTAVTLAGYQGKQLTLTAPPTIAAGCNDGFLGIWSLPMGVTNDLAPGDVDRIWILDAGGQRLVIDALQAPGEIATTTAEVQGIVDSIRIGPGASGPWSLITAPRGDIGEPASNPLNPGKYSAASPFLLNVTFTVPAGWDGSIAGPYAASLDQAQGPGAVYFSILDKVYADPCHSDQGFLDPLPGPSVDDLATALAHLPGLATTTPTAVTLAGYQGKQLTLTAPASASGCTDGSFGIWQLPLGATSDLTPGEVDKVWILDVDGERLVIDTPQTPGETGATMTEVQAIVASIAIAQRY